MTDKTMTSIDKLARGEEETKMEAENDEHVAVAVRVDNPQPQCEWREDTEDQETQMVFERTGPRCPNVATHRRCGPIVNMPVCEEHKCRCNLPLVTAPAQAEQPPAVASRGEVTDYQPPSNFELADIRYKAEKGQSERDAAGNRALFDAGRDSRADDMATVLDASQIIANTNKMLHGVIQKRDAEVAELKREVGTLGLELESARTVSDTLRQELEAEKAAHEKTKEHCESELAKAYEETREMCRRLDAHVCEKARAVPSREDIAKALAARASETPWQSMGLERRETFLGDADAVLGAGLESVKAEVAELRETVDRHTAELDPAVAHYREVNGKIAGVLEGLAKGGDLLKRLDELELQGRVVKRLCTDPGLDLHGKTWARIEREERERNK
jgi:hypothetical protein